MEDLIIIGAGPAGLTASIYASRYQLKNVVLGKTIGGTITLAHKVENYPGFVSISGLELGQKMAEQVKKLGVKILTENVIRLEKKGSGFRLATESKQELEGKTVIIATGTARRKLNVPGEKEYLGKGVSYCTTCDAAFFKGKKVSLVGGSNAAVAGAIHLAELADQVFIIYRRKELRAEPIWVERALKIPKIKVIYETNVIEVLGDGEKVTEVKLDKPYQNQEKIEVDGVFIEIGGVPGSELAKDLGVDLDEKGFVKVKADMRTNIPGVFAAGDIANATGEFRQLVTAVAEGALAADSAYRYLKGKNS